MLKVVRCDDEDAPYDADSTLFVFGWALPWPFPISSGTFSSSAVAFGRRVYGAGERPFTQRAHHLFWRLKDAKYWVYYRWHPKHRYNVVKTDLPPGYYDEDKRLLHAAMACLVGYEQECKASGCHDEGDEARAILHWWRVERPADQAEEERLCTELYGPGTPPLQFEEDPSMPGMHRVIFPERSEEDEQKRKRMSELETKICEDEQKYLHRLIDMRLSMWT